MRPPLWIACVFLTVLVRRGWEEAVAQKDPSSLYDEQNDGIIYLDWSNINVLLNESSRPWLVLFYAHWCGHCAVFAKVYKDFHREVRLWSLLVGAINCAAENNTDVCRDDFRIKGFPTLLLFPCKSNGSLSVAKDFSQFSSDRSVNSLRRVAAGFVINNTQCCSAPNRLGVLSRRLWNDFKESRTVFNLLLLVIGHQQPPHQGVVDSLVLDLAQCNRFAVALVDLDDKDTVLLFGSFTAPAMIGVGADSEIAVLSQNLDDYGELRLQLLRHYGLSCAALTSVRALLYRDTAGEDAARADSGGARGRAGTDDVHMADVIGGVGMSLRTEVARGELAGRDLRPIHDWVNVLLECIPWPAAQRELLHSLREWLVARGPRLNSSEWRSFFRSPQALAAFPTTWEWVSCRGQSASFRGYPCALWLTFHVMTVNCESASVNLQLNSVDVLRAVQGFVTIFFGCTSCREHFREMSKNLETEASTPEHAVLWLWHRHNLVNARLRRDDSADPTAPKIQYPLATTCPACRRPHAGAGADVFVSSPGYDVAPILWHRPSVLSFLRDQYGPSNIRIQEVAVAAADEHRDQYDPAVVSHGSSSRPLRVFAAVTIALFLFAFALFALLLSRRRRVARHIRLSFRHLDMHELQKDPKL